MTTNTQTLTKDKIYTLVAAIITTLENLNEPVVSGYLYAAMLNKVDLKTYQDIIDLMAASELISVTNHQITLLPKGVKLSANLTDITKK